MPGPMLPIGDQGSGPYAPTQGFMGVENTAALIEALRGGKENPAEIYQIIQFLRQFRPQELTPGASTGTADTIGPTMGFNPYMSRGLIKG